MSVVIDLSQTDTKAFKSENLIQVDAKISFEKLIENFIETIKDDNTQIDYCEHTGKYNNRHAIDRVHNTILINGKRGMGKTSFILSIEDAKKTVKKDEKILHDICSLGIIDPTLIETKEHVLLNIITLIKDKVDDYIRCQKCDYNAFQYKSWKESLKNLAGGLCMLDGIGTEHLRDNPLWDSPELVLEKGLSNAKQGVDLEKNFHVFISESLKIIEKKAFFLILDDIDTSLDKGIDILEILRKYLTSRELFIAMLGDIDLYKTLVRQLQWKKMDATKTLYDYEFDINKEKYRNQIEHLEEQYLVKILKPENRVDLKFLGKIANQESDFISIKYKDLVNKSLDEVMEEFGEKLLKVNNAYFKPFFKNIILNHPIRSIMQILKGMYTGLERNEMEIVVDTIKHTFISEIRQFEEYHLTTQSDSETVLNHFFKYLIDKKHITHDTYYKFLVQYPNECNSMDEIYLTGLINNFIYEKPANTLSYFIKIGYALEAVSRLSDNSNDRYIHHIGLNTQEPNINVAQRILSTFKRDTNIWQQPIRFGAIFIKSDLLKPEYINTNSTACFISGVDYGRDGLYNYFSIFNIIGLIADLIDMKEDEIPNLKTYLYSVDSYEQGAYGLINQSPEISLEKDFLEAIETWLKQYQQSNISVPLTVLSRIWERIQDVYSQYENGYSRGPKEFSIKEMIGRQMTAFLQAVFIETRLYAGKKVPTLRNAVWDDKEYKTNLAAKDETKDLFNFLYECPFFKSDFVEKIFGKFDKVLIPKNKSDENSKNIKMQVKQQFEKEPAPKKLDAVREALTRIAKNAGPEPKQALIDKNIDNKKLITSIVNQLRNNQHYLVGTDTGRIAIIECLKEIFAK